MLATEVQAPPMVVMGTLFSFLLTISFMSWEALSIDQQSRRLLQISVPWWITDSSALDVLWRNIRGNAYFEMFANGRDYSTQYAGMQSIKNTPRRFFRPASVARTGSHAGRRWSLLDDDAAQRRADVKDVRKIITTI